MAEIVTRRKGWLGARSEAGGYGYGQGYGSIGAGAVAGIWAGFCMGLLGMMVTYLQGYDLWTFPTLLGGVFYGVDALVTGGAAVIGAIAFLCVSALLGVIYSMFLRHDTSTAAALWGGALYGVCLWVIRSFITLPLINPMMKERMDLSTGAWFVENLVFGICLAVIPGLRRRYPAEALRETRVENRVEHHV